MAEDKPLYQCMSKVAAEAGFKLPEIATGAPDATIRVGSGKDTSTGFQRTAEGQYIAKDGSIQELYASTMGFKNVDGKGTDAINDSVYHIRNGKEQDQGSTTIRTSEPDNSKATSPDIKTDEIAKTRSKLAGCIPNS
jgi:hypothetical protein